MSMGKWTLSIDVGKKNLALCCLEAGADAHGREDVIRHWMVTSTLPTCQSLVDTLHAAGVVDWLSNVRDVVIERQPGRNTPMVRLQCYLEMYFAMHGKNVSLADSRHKLSFAASSPFWPGGILDSWSYYVRKKLAVQTTRNFLGVVRQPEGIAGMFDKSVKKDDLADSLLQGMAHIHFVAPLETARAQAKRARVPSPRRPSTTQLASGKLAKSHVVFLVRQASVRSVDDLESACGAFKPLRKAVERHFGSLEFCVKVLSSGAASPPASSLAPGTADTHGDEETGVVAQVHGRDLDA